MLEKIFKLEENNTTIKTVDPGTQPRDVLKNFKRRFEILLSERIYPANVNIGIDGKNAEELILYISSTTNWIVLKLVK